MDATDSQANSAETSHRCTYPNAPSQIPRYRNSLGLGAQLSQGELGPNPFQLSGPDVTVPSGHTSNVQGRCGREAPTVWSEKCLHCCCKGCPCNTYTSGAPAVQSLWVESVCRITAAAAVFKELGRGFLPHPHCTLLACAAACGGGVLTEASSTKGDGCSLTVGLRCGCINAGKLARIGPLERRVFYPHRDVSLATPALACGHFLGRTIQPRSENAGGRSKPPPSQVLNMPQRAIRTWS